MQIERATAMRAVARGALDEEAGVATNHTYAIVAPSPAAPAPMTIENLGAY